MLNGILIACIGLTIVGFIIFALFDDYDEETIAYTGVTIAGFAFVGALICVGLMVERSQEHNIERRNQKIICEHEGGIIVEDQCRELGEVIDI